jgi:hypothetical protein
MTRKTLILTTVLIFVMSLLFSVPKVLAATPTTSITITKYASDGNTVLDQTTVSYEWMMNNLPVQGDGVTHYYHQGPIFEGDMWDPDETENLKDKGAVQGTALKDLCELVGGMSPGDEIILKAVDGWHTEFAYENIYEPMDIQGVIALCWYNGEGANSGDKFGVGYPGIDGYNTAIQIVFMAGTANRDGDYVFGNSDMKICLPDEKYQHFYEGLPSTNGLSGKWISDVIIYSGEVPVQAEERLPFDVETRDSNRFPVIPLVIGVIGLVIISVSVIFLFRRRVN